MDFYQVLEKRRTIRDFSDKEVTEEVLEKVLSTAFKAPTNDHLRQFEFVVVRGQENIALFHWWRKTLRKFSRLDLKLLQVQWIRTNILCLSMHYPNNNVCLCKAIVLFCHSFAKRIALCVIRQIKVHSIISPRHGVLWRISCWLQLQRDYHVRSVFP